MIEQRMWRGRCWVVYLVKEWDKTQIRQERSYLSDQWIDYEKNSDQDEEDTQ